MGFFNDMLNSGESLFKNSVALEYDYVPKVIPFREEQQRYIATCMKPLLNQQTGKNLLLHGPPGIGKTVAVKNLFTELEQETDDVIPIYINCWQKNTSYKIMLEMCEILGYNLTVNKKTDELFRVVKSILNKKSVVFCFDEADKIEDFDFMYMILEEIYRKTVIMITNYYDWLIKLDPRIKSRLTPDAIEFKGYNQVETRGILKERQGFAFHDNVWETNAFDLISIKTAEIEDIRSGIYLMREAGNIAEAQASKKITLDHAKKAIEKLDEFTIKNTADLEDETKFILSLVKKHSGSKIGDLHKLYQKEGGKSVYKTFQRKIAKLEKSRFVILRMTHGGSGGNTTIVEYVNAGNRAEKKLTDF